MRMHDAELSALKIQATASDGEEGPSTPSTARPSAGSGLRLLSAVECGGRPIALAWREPPRC